MTQLTKKMIEGMPYVQFMALLDEVNRPPGGKASVRRAVQNSFITKDSKVLDIGCNTGYCSFEIAHLTKAHVTGIDISKEMVAAAKKYKAKDPLGNLVDFQVADGMKIPFKDAAFDVAFSGGSTAFIEDKVQAIREYARVVKPWGFVVDVNFYYHKGPPASLLKRLNDLLGIDIKPWKLSYWKEIYENAGLESYYLFTEKVKLVTTKEVRNYCRVLSQEKQYSPEVEQAIFKRLNKTMSLFNENHAYLSYGVFVYRKRPDKEQISLFDN
ncbi:MAG: hypothetical protein RL097_493 [Candidatus Parcubacteria bacterium]|jgi:ubiquinone/menaquinone biosynthesis C-methylase UbiE